MGGAHPERDAVLLRLISQPERHHPVSWKTEIEEEYIEWSLPPEKFIQGMALRRRILVIQRFLPVCTLAPGC